MNRNKSGRLATWKLVSGIFSIIFFIITELQSCSLLIADYMGTEDYGVGYIYGGLAGALILAAGIVSIATRHSYGIGSDIAVTVLYLLSVLFDVLSANENVTYALLVFWGMWNVVCAGMALISITLKCIQSNIRIAMIIILIILMLAGVYGLWLCTEHIYQTEDIDRDIVKRETLISDCIDDQLNWLKNPSIVMQSIQTFYKSTGVQPYLIITDNINGKKADLTDDDVESYLENMYDSLYDDENHMIFLFIEYESGEYLHYIYTGKEASTVITSNVMNYGLQLFDLYYTDKSLSEDELFKSFFEMWSEYFE